MAYVTPNRVQDTTTSTSTGVLALANNPPVGLRSFSDAVAAADLAIGDVVPITVQHRTANEWEVGDYTYSAANQLTRTTIYDSSNAGAAVNFSAGIKDVAVAQHGNTIEGGTF